MRDDQSRSDDDLIAETLGENLAAFETLVLRYRERLTRLAFRYVRNLEDARDLSQEAFARAYQQLHRYQSGGRFDRWLNRLTANLCLDFLRRRRPQLASPDETEAFLERVRASSPTPDKIAEFNDLRARFERELNALPEDWRLAFVLHEQEGLPHEEIAELTRTNVTTARWRLFKARQRLRERLSAYFSDE